MVTSKILNEGTALGMEQGRWVEDEGEGVESKRRREKTFTCFTLLLFSPSLPGAGGGQVGTVGGGLPTLQASSLWRVHS